MESSQLLLLPQPAGGMTHAQHVSAHCTVAVQLSNLVAYAPWCLMLVVAWAVDYPTSTMQEFQVLTGLAKNLIAK